MPYGRRVKHRLGSVVRTEAEVLALNAAAVKMWRKQNPERWKYLQENSKMKCLYGISLSEYAIMLELQNGACKVCERPAGVCTSTRQQRLHVEHNHTTGKVRGLVCARCNGLISAFEHPLAEKVVAYLEKDKAEH